jgi:hypothetical protein
VSLEAVYRVRLLENWVIRKIFGLRRDRAKAKGGIFQNEDIYNSNA